MRQGTPRNRLLRELFGSGEVDPFRLNSTDSKGRRPERAGVIFGAGGTVWLED